MVYPPGSFREPGYRKYRCEEKTKPGFFRGETIQKRGLWGKRERLFLHLQRPLQTALVGILWSRDANHRQGCYQNRSISSRVRPLVSGTKR
jgi:hypothetical protein